MGTGIHYVSTLARAYFFCTGIEGCNKLRYGGSIYFQNEVKVCTYYYISVQFFVEIVLIHLCVMYAEREALRENFQNSR